MIVQAYVKILKAFFRFSGKSLRTASNVYIHPLASIDPAGGLISIGRDTKILRGAVLSTYGGTIEIGTNVTVNPYTVLYGHGGLKIGNDVRIAAHVTIVPSSHRFEEPDTPIVYQGNTHQGITIEDDVWIGAGCVIVDGAHVGRGCVIGANAVVRGQLADYGVYAGVPAKLIRSRREIS